MTNNEILIDGVNVAECEIYPNHNKWIANIIYCEGGCEKYPTCNFKLLAREKAKNAELEADIATIKEERDNLRFKNEQLEAKVKELEKEKAEMWEGIKFCEKSKDVQREQWFQRCTELNSKFSIMKDAYIKRLKEWSKFKHTLSQIKEVAEKASKNMTDALDVEATDAEESIDLLWAVDSEIEAILELLKEYADEKI